MNLLLVVQLIKTEWAIGILRAYDEAQTVGGPSGCCDRVCEMINTANFIASLIMLLSVKCDPPWRVEEIYLCVVHEYLLCLRTAEQISIIWTPRDVTYTTFVSAAIVTVLKVPHGAPVARVVDDDLVVLASRGQHRAIMGKLEVPHLILVFLRFMDDSKRKFATIASVIVV